MKCFNKAILGRILLTLVTLVALSTGVSKAGWTLTSPKGEVTVIETRYAEYVLWQLKNKTTPLTYENWLNPPKPLPEVATYDLINGQFIPLNAAARAMPIKTNLIQTVLQNTFGQSTCPNGKCPKQK